MTIGNLLMLQPLLIGWLFGVFGSYEVPYLGAAVVSAVGASILSTAGPATFRADD